MYETTIVANISYTVHIKTNDLKSSLFTKKTRYFLKCEYTNPFAMNYLSNSYQSFQIFSKLKKIKVYERY